MGHLRSPLGWECLETLALHVLCNFVGYPVNNGAKLSIQGGADCNFNSLLARANEEEKKKKKKNKTRALHLVNSCVVYWRRDLKLTAGLGCSYVRSILLGPSIAQIESRLRLIT